MLPELRSSHESLSWPKAKGFIVIRASHKTITGNACRTIKLLVIQQVGSSPTLLKATSCRTRSMFVVETYFKHGANVALTDATIVQSNKGLRTAVSKEVFYPPQLARLLYRQFSNVSRSQ